MGIKKAGKSGIKKTGKAGSGTKTKIAKGGKTTKSPSLTKQITSGLTKQYLGSDLPALVSAKFKKGGVGVKAKGRRRTIISKRAMKNIRRVAGYRKQLMRAEKVFNRLRPFKKNRMMGSSRGYISKSEIKEALAR